jgi:hypothetical protein
MSSQSIGLEIERKDCRTSIVIEWNKNSRRGDNPPRGYGVRTCMFQRRVRRSLTVGGEQRRSTQVLPFGFG